MVQELEDTYVEATTDGYFVHVFYTPTYGCGQFETDAVEVKVTYDGYFEEYYESENHRKICKKWREIQYS